MYDDDSEAMRGVVNDIVRAARLRDVVGDDVDAELLSTVISPALLSTVREVAESAMAMGRALRKLRWCVARAEDATTLHLVTPAALTAWVEARGWTRDVTEPRWATHQHPGPRPAGTARYVYVPTDPCQGDYADAVRAAIEAVEGAGTAKAFVLYDVLPEAGPWDVPADLLPPKREARPDPVLCYVSDGWAWFTTCPLAHQRGDDWDDAGTPYPWREGCGVPPYELTVVALHCGDYCTPDEFHRNSTWSVDAINRGEVAWLRSNHDGARTLPPIRAGTPLSEFKRLVRAAGGKVYVEE